jgi:hypothetical protein
VGGVWGADKLTNIRNRHKFKNESVIGWQPNKKQTTTENAKKQ